MKVWLLDLDGKIPNLALMRLAAHHLGRGDLLEMRRVRLRADFELQLWDEPPDAVYASLLYDRSRPLAQAVLERWPRARVGGTGWDLATDLEDLGIGPELDYGIYPDWQPSLGFTQRGCRRQCPWCVTPVKDGRNRAVATIPEIYRGAQHPKRLFLLDQDFFGQPAWGERVREMSGFAVCFNGGIDCRSLTETQAAALASVRVTDNEFKTRRVYTAWDRLGDAELVLRGLRRLVKHFTPRTIMVYMLVGFDPDEDHQARELRRTPLRDLGVLLYIMPYRRTPELLGYQRWVNFSYDKRKMTWSQWEAEGYQAHEQHRREARVGQTRFDDSEGP